MALCKDPWINYTKLDELLFLVTHTHSGKNLQSPVLEEYDNKI